MIIWNGKDIHLQKPPAGRRDARQRIFLVWNGGCRFHAFVRLNDSAQRSLVILPKSHYALIDDRSAYELDINLNGQTL